MQINGLSVSGLEYQILCNHLQCDSHSQSDRQRALDN